MNGNIPRREFMKRAVVAGAGLVSGPAIVEALADGQPAPTQDLCAVRGDRYFDNTFKAIDGLGGMQKFVRRGNTVGILVNSPLDRFGAHTNPDIALAVVKMCVDAGAKQVIALNEISREYWRRSRLYDSMKSTVDGIQMSEDTTDIDIPKGKSLKKAEVAKALLSCNVYINIPIIKDHEGTRFTGNLKNTMGACTGSTCRRFHYGESNPISSLFSGGYSNLELLAQCIADINLVRQPDLCVVDATEILATNGPSGPGEIRKPKEIIASTNCLAADMYATKHLGLNWEDLLVIRYAQQHGYGPSSLKDVKIKAI
jgi:uncharacterized protein (DUF362 family)